MFPPRANKKDAEALAAGRDVAVDNTSPSAAEWRPLIEAARAGGAQAVAYWFPPDLAASLRRNAARQGRSRVPDAGLRAVVTRLRRPETADGLDAVVTVRFGSAGGFHTGPDNWEAVGAG